MSQQKNEDEDFTFPYLLQAHITAGIVCAILAQTLYKQPRSEGEANGSDLYIAFSKASQVMFSITDQMTESLGVPSISELMKEFGWLRDAEETRSRIGQDNFSTEEFFQRMLGKK